MLLRIHGGPDWQDYHEFEPERQLFAAKGYAVLNVNYRGSTGRDTAYQQAIFRDWGNKEVVDLLACVDEAIKEGVPTPTASALEDGAMAAFSPTTPSRHHPLQGGDQRRRHGQSLRPLRHR